jgi:uncharacterized cupin superfamily protein
MPNVYRPKLEESPDGRRARLGRQAGSVRMGMSLYEFAPGEGMVFHYHLAREELLIVLAGRLSLRTAGGWEELPEGEVVAFPRGARGAHGYENRSSQPVRALVISEMDGPNVSVYPDENRIGVFDAALPEERRFGALFDVDAALADYGGGKAELTPPAPRPRSSAD